jgi:hypothetical protein
LVSALTSDGTYLFSSSKVAQLSHSFQSFPYCSKRAEKFVRIFKIIKSFFSPYAKTLENGVIMTQPGNIFTDIPTHLPQEFFQTLVNTPNLHIERIVPGTHASPEGVWYDRKTPEWVLLIQGAALLQFEGEDPFLMCCSSLASKEQKPEQKAQPQYIAS